MTISVVLWRDPSEQPLEKYERVEAEVSAFSFRHPLDAFVYSIAGEWRSATVYVNRAIMQSLNDPDILGSIYVRYSRPRGLRTRGRHEIVYDIDDEVSRMAFLLRYGGEMAHRS